MENQTAPSFKQHIATLMQWAGIMLAAIGAVVQLGESAFLSDPVSRFLVFSLIIVVSAGLGGYLIHRRDDGKNGAILTGIFLACVPIFWSQFASLVYAATKGISSAVPELLRMPVPSNITMIEGGAIALLAIIPLTFFVARLFMPKMALNYALLLSALGALFCLPVRTGSMAEVVLIAITLAVFACERHWLISEEEGNTFKGKFARAVVLGIAILLQARALCYAQGAVLNFSFFMTIGLVVHWIYTSVAVEKTLGAFVADCATALALSALVELGKGSLTPELLNLMSYAVPAFYLLAQGSQEEKEVWLWNCTGVVVLAYFSYLFRSDISLLTQIAAFSFSLGGVVYAYRTRSMATLLVTAGLFLGNFTWLIDLLLRTLIEYRWSILMVSGIGLIFGSSYVEHGVKKIQTHWLKNS